jgi:SAM-dependent methyltransferase
VSSSLVQRQAIVAFDGIAEQYDDLFTCSTIGRAQRGAVWNVLLQTFHPGDHILELNCGTGEDAVFLARHGIAVTGYDASEKMIDVARRRARQESPRAEVRFGTLPTEYLSELRPSNLFDGVFSNFSGLNCVADLDQVCVDLASLVPIGAPFLVCLSTRFCMMETVWFLLHGALRKAFRRYRGRTSAIVGQFTVDVRYPLVNELRRSFAPHFKLHSYTGIGIFVPPSYVEPWICRFPYLLSLLRSIDEVVSSLPLFRVIGDHMLLRFERVQA